MENIMTILAFSSAIILDVILELKHIQVPTIVSLVAGFAVRHLIGDKVIIPINTDNTPKNASSVEIKAVPEGVNP